MAATLKDLLAGKEQKVIEDIRRIGISATMEQYGLKDRKNFLAWVRRITSEGFYPPNFKGMKGGVKAKWLRDNREFVLKCAETWGTDFILENLNLKELTLYNLAHSEKSYHSEIRQEKMNMDRIVNKEIVTEQERQKMQIEMLREDVANLRKEIRDLKSIYYQFVEGVSKRIGEALVIPLVQHLTAPDKDLNLSQNDFILKDTTIAHSDPLLGEALELSRNNTNISATILQKHLRIGQPRSMRLMNQIKRTGFRTATNVRRC